MAKLTADERAALEARLAADDEEPEEFDVWVRKDGHEVKLTGAKATNFLKRLGIDTSDVSEESSEEEDGEEEDAAADSIFRKRRRG
jgi:hypothetical protein